MISLGLNKNAVRMLTGFIMGTLVMLSIIYGGIPMLIMLIFMVFMGSWEYVKILNHKGFYPSLKVICLTQAILTAVVFFKRFDLVAITLTICAMCSFMWVLFKGRQPYIANVATTLLGMVYCGWFPLHLLFLRDLGSLPAYSGIIKYNVTYQGACYALFLLFAVILTDTFCYYAGLRFGKHKLSKVISPNKTVEGSIGGTLTCMIFCMIFGPVIQVPWYHSIIIGLLIAGFAQIGDLCESMIKRDAGVKDSSNLLPGHGGFLDRTDSYILTIPVLHYYLYFFVVNNFFDLFRGIFPC